MPESTSPAEAPDTDATPPPLPEAEPRPTPYVAYLCIALCVTIWAGITFDPAEAAHEEWTHTLAPFAPRIWHGEWWGLLSAAFVHQEFWHLLFNMIWLREFGRILEPRWGSLKFAAFTLAAAPLASGAQLAFTSQTGIGFSGVIYAYFGYVAALRHHDVEYHAFVNPRLMRWMIGWFFFCIVLTAANVWNVGNFAHGAGLLFGWLIGFSLAKKRFARFCYAGLAFLVGVALVSATWVPWSPIWRERTLYLKFLQAKDDARDGNVQAEFEYGMMLLPSSSSEHEGVKWLQKAATAGHTNAMNTLAWRYATDSRPAFRNPPEALRLAQLACEKEAAAAPAAFLDTLAAAHAALDQWDEAVATQSKAIEKLKPEDEKHRAGYLERLEKFQRHEKLRIVEQQPEA